MTVDSPVLRNSKLKGQFTLKPSSHIGDTTRHDSMRHDPFFRFPFNQMDQFTHMQHDNNALSSRQKAAAPKITLEAISDLFAKVFYPFLGYNLYLQKYYPYYKTSGN